MKMAIYRKATVRVMGEIKDGGPMFGDIIPLQGFGWVPVKDLDREPFEVISQDKILEFMEKRMEALRQSIELDFGGGLYGRHGEFREVKYWKEAIERGEFDVK